eukprot:5891346-Pyramimonas_sp.AAC.1
MSLQYPFSEAWMNFIVTPILSSRDSAAGGLRNSLSRRSATARMQFLNMRSLPRADVDGLPWSASKFSSARRRG